MACCHDHALVIDAQGRHFAGQEAVRRNYETSFALFPDGRCDLACSPAMMARVWQSPSFMAADRRRAKSLMLSVIYNWLTEGFDTKDLQEDKALLEELVEGR